MKNLIKIFAIIIIYLGLHQSKNVFSQTTWSLTSLTTPVVSVDYYQTTSIVYALTDNGSNYICKKSTDGGNSWATTSLTLSKTYSAVLKVNRNSGDVYVYQSNNLYRSSDQGQTWANVGGSSVFSGSVQCLYFMPNNVAYCGTMLGGALYRSLNGGTSWTNLNLSIPNLYGVGDVEIMPNGYIFLAIVATGTDMAVYRSVNNFASFQKIGLTGYGIYALEKSNNDIIASGNAIPGIYSSSDYGVNWTKVSTYYSGETYQLETNPSNPVDIISNGNVFVRAIGASHSFSTITGNITATIKDFTFYKNGGVFAATLGGLYKLVPTFTIQPQNVTTCVGSSATFSASANDVLSYQWQVFSNNVWSNISGATASTYSIPSVTLSMNSTMYRVIATNACGSTTSNSAALYVGVPTITAQPQNVTVPINTSATFSISTTGATSYQWQTLIGGSWSNISGANASTYTIASATLGMNNSSYRVVVSNSCGSVTSVAATLKLNYCQPSFIYGTLYGIYIGRVSLVNLNNITTASASPFYTFYSNATIPTLTANQSYSLAVSAGTYTSGNIIAAWIDFNNDFDFDDAGEKLGEVNVGAYPASASITFTVPGTSQIGNHRMRVREVYGSTSLSPCSTYNYGETEDYIIYNEGPCVTPAITGTTPAGRHGTGTVVLGASASAGTIKWYASPTGGTALGTGSSFTTPTISATTTYYIDATYGLCISSPRVPVMAVVNTSNCVSGPAVVTESVSTFYGCGNFCNCIGGDCELNWYVSPYSAISNISYVDNTTFTIVWNSGFSGMATIRYECNDGNYAGSSEYYDVYVKGTAKSMSVQADQLQNETSGINIFPNPVLDKLTIEGDVDINKIDIYDIDGKIVYKSNKLVGKTNTIDVRDLKSGVYMACINNSIFRKFIK